MKWAGLILAFYTVAVSAAPAPTSTASQAVLRWNNGETIIGEIDGGTNTALTWKSPVFQEPLVLRWSALRRIDRTLSPSPVSDPFTVRVRDGSVLHGDLVAIANDSITLRSARHGETVLKRDEVLSLRRARGPNLLFLGPAGDSGWSEVTANDLPKATPASAGGPFAVALEEGPGGSLAMPYWNTSARLELPLPEKIDAEFRVTSTVRPDFAIALEAGARQRLRIETWDDELMLVAANQFKRIRKVDDNERAVAMRVCWDRVAGRCSIYSPEGDLVLEWQVPEEKDPVKMDAEKVPLPLPQGNVRRRVVSKTRDAPVKPGLVLHGKGRDLALEYLKLRPWNGQAPARLDLKSGRIELADGRTVVGEVIGVENGTIRLRAGPDEPEQSLPLTEVDSIVFPAKELQPAARELKLWFSDGTLLFGKPLSIAEGRLLLECSFTQQPLATTVEGLRRMLIRSPAAEGTPAEVPLAQLDKLVAGELTLHGVLTGSGKAAPQWRLVGSESPVTPVKGKDAEITRAIPPGHTVEPASALFYLDAGDVIPGRLRSIDRSGVELESNVVELKRLPAATVNAVQFGAATRAKFDGFLDPGWRVIKGTDETVRRTDTSLRMEPDTVIGHPSALFASEIKFSMQSKGYSSIRLRLFCSGTDPSKCTNLVLMHMGNRVTAGIDDGEGQFENENQVGVAAGKPIKVRIAVTDRQITLSVNGYQLQKYPIDAAKRAGAGLVIEPCSMWGNSVNPLELADFSANSDVGKTWLPDIPADTKTRALTVPRFRKDDAPRHVLLAANGDVLRGEIEAITTGHFGFRSGLENLRIPRDRVKAAIWLKKGDGEAPVAPGSNRVAERLAQRINGRSMYGGAPLSVLVDFIKRQDAELKFRLPKNQDNRTFEMSFGNQSLGDALEEICSLFGMRYRIDDDGTIVIETGTQPATEMVQRSYWLKTEAFKSGTLREVLTSKGVPFPTGAGVSWKPAARQLSVVNTEVNHKKLTDLLESDFGGITGSPTHWLALTSGARFSLIIDQFGSDAVTGHHPVYGVCRVPIQDIHMIRTSAPEPSEAIKSVADWRLVFAPEPVLPETPGESSPLLGKPAKAFKLPLLGGGDLELAKEQGKVVILDFWATWCGPCIKSLPGLIEAVSKFPADRVRLIGVNQGEPPEQVKQFIETRRWALTVALDSSQSVGRDYGVEGIPFTVIVGPDGKVAWVHTGYAPEGEAEVTKVVEELLKQPRS